MGERSTAARLRRLPRVRALGLEVAVADDLLARLFGLAWLDRDQAGTGLLIPRCSCVHTFGMRFALDVAFLDRDRRAVEIRTAVPVRRVIARRGAWAVLETPSPIGLD
jgi:uncharacterized membrane protein (UPF0127 family)